MADVVTQGPPRHLVLVGMMGAGKTTVGEAVAARLDRRFADSDELIEARTGRTVREIFEADGEAAFRALETEALVEALDDHEPLVIAAAGGVVLRQANRDALTRDDALVVWLQADPEVLADRVEVGDHRPLLGDDPEAALRRLLPEREQWYAEVADEVVDTGGLPVDQVVDRIVALAGEAARD
ncbi:MAG: shikimate kinase [Ilumatobacteraceae bacterium]